MTIANQQNSDLYKKTLNHLWLSLEVEEEQYKAMHLNYDKIISLFNYLEMIVKGTIQDVIINQNYNSRIYYRILNKLLIILHNNKFLCKNYIKENITSLEVDIEAIKQELDLGLAIEEDITSSFTLHLQQLIDNDTYQPYRKQLIMTKFLCSFIYDNPNFIMDDSLLSHLSIFDVIAKEYKMLDAEKREFTLDTQEEGIISNIESLLSLPDEKGIKKRESFKLLIRKCYLLSYLELFDLSHLFPIKNKIERIIVRHNLLDHHAIGSSLVMDAIENTVLTKKLKKNKKT